MPIKYFKSHWSFAKIKLEEKNKKCGFSAENLFTIITAEGNFYLLEIPKEGGKLKTIQNLKFFESC